ncbi:hypothetical protein TanjilG_06133 [Lupinus angustifolius]|uniref:Secreted protein n=1 Tax=Lupinus angustifolius TaxID=3871 RepID=A0A394DFJ7_LUPAN|nr:hypothetical protein TanjilG_06133 [Lupinus angustifolius]
MNPRLCRFEAPSWLAMFLLLHSGSVEMIPTTMVVITELNGDFFCVDMDPRMAIWFVQGTIEFSTVQVVS